MAASKKDLRKRKGSKKEETKNETSSAPISPKNEEELPPQPPPNETAWQTFKSHWMVRYMLPLYLLYAAVEFHWSLQERILQRPESLMALFPFLKLRPPVDHHEERQLLIVGTMSSGTRQIAASLNDVLHLEIGHEMSDSQTNYCRDGTVSWIFGIRYLPRPPSVLQLAELCQQATYAVGFHPRMYRGNICSQNQHWSRCWAQECVDILHMEWGCAFRPNNQCRNFQPFRKVLHQTRHPLKVVSSLVAKFCRAAPEKRDDFIRITRLLFGHVVDFETTHPMSCLEVVGYHVLEYNKALIHAREKGLIHGMYKIEEATPCQVAELGGLANADVVYPPNADSYQTACLSATTTNSTGHQPMKPKGKYKVNQNRVQLTWEDLEGGRHESQRPTGDRSLVQEMQELARAMGYM